MDRPSLCVIYNPRAGRGHVGRLWRRLRQTLGPTVEYRATCGPGHAIELAEQAARAGFGTVAAAGGDGTAHEVANGLLRAGLPGTAFGVIPLGSGNDYARMLRLPGDPERLARRLFSRDTWPVDVGRVRADGGRCERFFVNTLGLGLSGVVTYEARQIQWLRGLPLYGLAAVRAIYRSFRAIPTIIQLDDQPLLGPTLYLAVALGVAEGGGFVVAPEARLDDGWFDILHAGALSRLAALGYLPRLALGRPPESGGAILRGRCRRLSIIAEEPLYGHCDGELFSHPAQPHQRFEVTLLPGALPIRGGRPALNR
jgi:diacylglycerol kinase (ATP)